jgi:catechol 2,3-dioxygenase-like lactoylglutathione lyase family enzyme
MFNKVSAVVLFAQNFDASLAFYRDTLGLQVSFSDDNSAAFEMAGQGFVLLKPGAAADMIDVDVATLEARPRADRAILCVRVEDVNTLYETYKARGVVFTKPPEDKPWGIRAAYFRDPEGNIWEVAQLIDPEKRDF